MTGAPMNFCEIILLAQVSVVSSSLLLAVVFILEAAPWMVCHRSPKRRAKGMAA